MNRTARSLLAPLGMSLLLSTSAQAALLELSFHTHPDIDLQVDAATLHYDAVSQQLVANNLPGSGSFTFTPEDGDNKAIIDGQYQLTASIDHSGNLLSGTLNVTGAVAALGILDANTVLLSGDITAFGHLYQQEVVSPFVSLDISMFDFRIDQLSGALASHYSTGLYVSLSSLADTDFAGSFATGFTVQEVYAGNTALVPVPAALWLLGSGLIGLASVVRRRHAR